VERKYANHIEVGHNRHEFVLDFGQAVNTGDSPCLHTGIVTSPFHARAMLDVLEASWASYCERFGGPESSRKRGGSTGGSRE
jgi:hypothetical protein